MLPWTVICLLHRNGWVRALLLLGALSWLGFFVFALDERTDRVPSRGEICLIFTGSRMSELEPCGCQASQNGGVDREAEIYRRLREKYPGLVAMEVGKWVDPFQSPNEKLKTDYLVKALHDLDFDVYNITPYDLAYGTTYPLQLVEGGRGHLISANLLVEPNDSPAKGLIRPFDPYVILDVPLLPSGEKVRVGVIGVTDPAAVPEPLVERLRSSTKALPRFQLGDVTEALEKYVPIVRAKCDLVVVLELMGRMTALEMARRIKGIDIFVNSMENQAWRNPQKAGASYCFSTGQLGRYFTKAVVGLDSNLHPSSITGGLVDIPSDANADPAITKYIEQYKQATKDLVRRRAMAREKSRFAGRSRCLSCHRDAYLQWTRTPHNLAYASLVRKQQNYNPDCLKCHVTGYGQPDGFVDVTQTGYLVAVQCEECHGPANEHVKVLTKLLATNPEIRMGKIGPGIEYPRLLVKPPKEICTRCHDGDNDRYFEYERDIKIVSHENMNGPFRREEQLRQKVGDEKRQERGTLRARARTRARVGNSGSL